MFGSIKEAHLQQISHAPTVETMRNHNEVSLNTQFQIKMWNYVFFPSSDIRDFDRKCDITKKKKHD